MRVLLLAIALVLATPLVALAPDQLYLSRTITIDFRGAGKITTSDSTGHAPADEKVQGNSYILVMPKSISFTLSMGHDNAYENRYLIGIVIKDDLAPTQKVEDHITANDTTKMLWLDRYRYEIILLKKEASSKGNFVTASLKLNVYAPAPNPPKPKG